MYANLEKPIIIIETIKDSFYFKNIIISLLILNLSNFSLLVILIPGITSSFDSTTLDFIPNLKKEQF